MTLPSETKRKLKLKKICSFSKNIDILYFFFLQSSPFPTPVVFSKRGLSGSSVSCCYATERGPKYYARHFGKPLIHELELCVRGEEPLAIFEQILGCDGIFTLRQIRPFSQNSKTETCRSKTRSAIDLSGRLRC